ncbi:NUDIX hydrolase [Streptomyces sp. SPB162]|uniref:NUDIX hydrolase n=1 Tax=Streptomyces sp. SPB162 TaxID=2940560 RepID=UPI00240555EE|nr:NUDIX hydrolase [Streptomyces sp. SPB162]MDF9811461.1 8-oxo-dGTP pyrophosphatase MutT (NUDIX family) [Streptomyces sp. SPB162]
MGYIQEMRALVGTRPLLLPGALAIIRNDQHEILLTRRTDTKEWSLPGGHMEPGETLAETAAREVHEEIGLGVEELEFIDFYSGPEFFYRYPNGDEIYKVTAVFATLFSGGDLNLDDAEVLEALFFSRDNLPGDLFSQERYIIEKYFENR